MKLVSFIANSQPGYGAIVDGKIVRLDNLPEAPNDLKSFIASTHGNSPSILPGGRSEVLKLDSVDLLPPVPNPGKIICVATNFHEPSRDDKPVPAFPLVFTRFAESLAGHQRHLIKPEVSDQYDFEGELAVVIGKYGYKIAREQAMNFVAGYSCFNDGSVRDWQKHSSQFTPGKNFYQSGSMGPWLVTIDEIRNIYDSVLTTKVNGEIRQQISLSDMIFDIPWLISYFSTFIPLCPGDVIATGTPSGFGASRTPQEFVSTGDVIEVSITDIGRLQNEVIS